MLLFNRIVQFPTYYFYYSHIILVCNQLLCTSSLTIRKLNQTNLNIIISQQKQNDDVQDDYRSIDEYSSFTESYNEKKRNKRWANLFLGVWGMCWHYPLCCDVDGEDTCSFFCPVCPLKSDIYGRPITTTTSNPLEALIALRASQGGRGSGSGRLNALELLSGRGGNNDGIQAGNGNLGSGGNTKDKDVHTAGMLVMSALMGAQMATASSQSSLSTPSPAAVARPTLPPAVCANPDIIRNLLRQNPERVRMLARTFGFGELPEGLTADTLDLSTFCDSSS